MTNKQKELLKEAQVLADKYNVSLLYIGKVIVNLVLFDEQRAFPRES